MRIDMEWVNIKDRLPDKERMEYLCYFDDECYLLCVFHKYEIDGSHWISDGFTVFPTHWMELPEAPKQ